jgi:hypothetical protein
MGEYHCPQAALPPFTAHYGIFSCVTPRIEIKSTARRPCPLSLRISYGGGVMAMAPCHACPQAFDTYLLTYPATRPGLFALLSP